MENFFYLFVDDFFILSPLEKIIIPVQCPFEPGHDMPLQLNKLE